jgi:hypothetical protein
MKGRESKEQGGRKRERGKRRDEGTTGRGSEEEKMGRVGNF